MKQFIKRSLIFILIPVMFILVLSIVIPPTPRTSSSLLFAKLDKDKLLANTPTPRLILIGGSNLSFGIDSSIIKERTGLNPVNTAIHASLGLKYMMEETKDYIRPGDIVLIAAEYSQFYKQDAYGREELLRTVLDVDRKSLRGLNLRQWVMITRYIPKYSMSKIKPSEYVHKEPNPQSIYLRQSFNEFGDVDIHWTLDNEYFDPYPPISGRFNQQIIEDLLEFEAFVADKGATLFVTYPGLGAQSYEYMEEQILHVERVLSTSGLVVLGTPDRFSMPRDLLFNTPYHLNRTGVEYRTGLLIEDLMEVINPGD